MLETLFGNRTAEKIFLYMANYRTGYATKISKTFGFSLSMVQKQLDKLEQGGILISNLEGRTRLYQFNPRYFLYKELLLLLSKALEFIPDTEKQKHYMQRTRPRRRSKPL